MKITYIGTQDVNLHDMPYAIKKMGHEVRHIKLNISTLNLESDSFDLVKNAIQTEMTDAVITHDFCRTIAYVCYDLHIPYISWVYDSPQKEIYTKEAFLPTNYIFVFDRNEYIRLKEIGLQNVYHTTLGVEEDVFFRPVKAARECKNSVTFVGQLYHNPYLEDDIQNASNEMRELIEDGLNQFYLKWNEEETFHGNMSQKELIFWEGIDGKDICSLYPYMKPELYYEAAVNSRILASRERRTILEAVGRKTDMHFYTFAPVKDYLSKNVILHNGIGYSGESADIYNTTKINLNITLHCIETGACQRIFDVMAAGGFLLTNYQEELAEMFIPDKEIVFYHNIEELLDKIDYYLKHENERIKIAEAGQHKVLANYTYQTVLRQVWNIVEDDERLRNEKQTDSANEKESSMVDEYLDIAKKITNMAQLIIDEKMQVTEVPYDFIITLIEDVYGRDGSLADVYIESYGNLFSQGLVHQDRQIIANTMVLLANHISMFYGMDQAKIQDNIEKYKLHTKITHMMNEEKNRIWYSNHSNLKQNEKATPFTGKGVVYSAITGNYDDVYEPKYKSENLDYIFFTDNKDYKSDIWEVRYLDNPDGLDSVRLAKRVKMLGHEYLKGYDYSIWIDGKLKIVDDLEEYVKTYRKTESMLCCSHYKSDCIYDELDSCIALNKDNPDIMRAQVERYRLEGYPAHNGLIDAGFMVRDLHDEKLKAVMETWWNENLKGSRRDQLSFNYSCWKNDYIYDTSGLFIYENKYLELMGHK